jgi:O-antigen/teichoic acid export membrane protein
MQARLLFKEMATRHDDYMNMLRNSILYFFSTGLNKGLPFLLLPLLTRYISVENFGYLGVAMVFVSVLSLIFGFNPTLFIIANFHKLDKHDIGKYIYHIFILTIICCVLVSVITLLFSDLLLRYGITTGMTFVIILVALSRVFISIGLVLLQMEKRAWDYLKVNIAFALPLFTLIFISIVNYSLGWTSVFISELIVGAGLTGIIIFYLYKNNYLIDGLQKEVFKEILTFSIPLIPHVLAFWAINFIDRLFLAEMTDMKTVGLYSTAYMLGLGISLIHESIHRAWQPYFFEYLAEESEKRKQQMVKLTWLYYGGSIAIFFVYVGLIKLLLPIVVGEEYMPALDYIPLIVLGYTVFGMYRVIAGYLYHLNKTVLLASISSAAAVLNIILNYYLIPINGGIGAAQATLISFCFLFIVVKIAVIKSYDMRWFGVFSDSK